MLPPTQQQQQQQQNQEQPSLPLQFVSPFKLSSPSFTNVREKRQPNQQQKHQQYRQHHQHHVGLFIVLLFVLALVIGQGKHL